MEQPPKPSNESERLDVLDDYQVLDTPPDASFDRITWLASRILKTPIALVSLVDDERQWFKSRQRLETEETPRDVGFCAHAICEEDVMVVPDASRDQRFAESPLVTEEPNVRFYAGAPLHDGAGHVLGTLCVLDTAPREIDGEDEATLKSLASVVMDEMHLRRLASFDPLTALPNRRYFIELGGHERRRALRHGYAACVAMIDIDHFKLVNDRHGHDAGDAVLIAFSGLFADAFRKHDMFCRYGGEEFAVLMPHTNVKQAQTVARRLRSLASTRHVDIESGKISFTISIGVTPWYVGVETIEDALKRADTALYDAKTQGRDRVVSTTAGPASD